MRFKQLVNVLEVITLVAAAAFVVALFVNQPGDDGGATSSPGASIFAANCASCHGRDGGGGVGPQLSDGKVVDAYPDVADQIAVVTKGRSGMPSFAGDLTDEQIRQVVEFTRTELGG
jgi:mono/diheme cytochrome c family protein